MKKIAFALMGAIAAVIYFGFVAAKPASACPVSQQYPCGFHPRVYYYHPHRIVHRTAVGQSCRIIVEDRTSPGQYYGMVNHAQVFVMGGPSNGRKTGMIALRKGTNFIGIPCGAALATKVIVCFYENQVTYQNLTAQGALSSAAKRYIAGMRGFVLNTSTLWTRRL